MNMSLKIFNGRLCLTHESDRDDKPRNTTREAELQDDTLTLLPLTVEVQGDSRPKQPPAVIVPNSLIWFRPDELTYPNSS